MKELEAFVERLFSTYKKTDETAELKQEILSNLEAKVTDYMKSGMSYSDAVDKATKNFDSIGLLVEQQRSIYINRYRLHFVQNILIYLLIFWIISIPLRVVHIGLWINGLFSLAILIFGLVYVLLQFFKDDQTLDTVRVLDTDKLKRASRWTWLIWGFYAFAMAGYTTAIRFGSDIWFSRPIHIDGPYQFALLAIEYVYPLLTIVIPLLVQRGVRLVYKYEVNQP